MKTLNPRWIAIAGVLLAAVAAVAVLQPALHSFAYGQLSWVGVAYALVPLLVLWVSGARFYGPLVAGLLAAVITAIVVIVTAVLFVLALGLSLSGSGSSSIFLLLVWILPPLIILGLGLPAIWVVRSRTDNGD